MRGMSRAVLMVLALVGCGGAIDEESNAPAEQNPVTVDAHEQPGHIHEHADYTALNAPIGSEEPGDDGETTVCTCSKCGKRHPLPCHLY